MKAVIVIPAYNEAETLEEKMTQLEAFRAAELPEAEIIITDNNSTDATPEIAAGLSRRHEKVHCYSVARQGKGAAIRDTWLAHDYDIYSFMDVDLSTDLSALPLLFDAIREGYDMAIGSRYREGAVIERSLKRELVSRAYRLLFHFLLCRDIRDPQCGFKAVSRKVRDTILPGVGTPGFFFDSELLVRAQKAGYRIKEVPVRWREDSGTTVHLARDVPKFVKGLIALKYELIVRKANH